MSKILMSEVYGRKKVNNADSLEVIGSIFSESHLSSAEFEIVTLEFDGDFKGVESSGYNQGGKIMTFAKTIVGSDRDIVSPIVMITSSYRDLPIHVLSSGIISRVLPPTIKKSHDHPPLTVGDGSCTVVVVIPGKDPTLVNEWMIKIPDGIRMDRKVIYIKKFNIYIGGCSEEQMAEIRDGNMVVASHVNNPRALVDIHIRGNVAGVKLLHICFNGIFGRVELEPTVDHLTTVVLRVGDTTLTERIPNKDILNMEYSISKVWKECGGIELLIDVDRDRLSRSFKELQAAGGPIPPDAVSLVNKLRDEILNLGNKVSDKESQIRDLKNKISDADVKLKIQQEEFKTRREEIKYHGTIADQRTSVVMDTIKIGGALLGVLSLVITLASKYGKDSSKLSSRSGLIEWATPVIFSKGSEIIISNIPVVIGAVPANNVAFGVIKLIGMLL